MGWDLFRSGSRWQETQQANYLRKFPNLGDARLIMCNVSGKVIINFIESFRAFYPDDASAPGLRPHHNLQHRRRPCKSRSQTQVQHYTETTLSPDRYFHGTLSPGIRSGWHAQVPCFLIIRRKATNIIPGIIKARYKRGENDSRDERCGTESTVIQQA